MTNRTVVAAAAALLTACAPETPTAPTWDDVRPILAANCARCHGAPPLQGAPDGFRLDLYGDHVVPLGDAERVVALGAATLAPFIAERAAVRADMPPGGPPLSDRQRAILLRWAEAGAPPGSAGEPAAVTLLAPPAVASGEIALRYEIRDPERGGVTGALFVDEVAPGALLVDELHAGRHEIRWDSDTAAPGPHRLLAVVDDGAGPRELELAAIRVERDGPAAPSARVLAPLPDDLAVAGEPAELSLLLADPDSAALTVEAHAVRDGERIEVVARSAAAPGAVVLPWDPSAVPPGPDWRIEVTVSDGAASRTALSPRFIVGHGASDLTYADLAPLLTERCRPCHSSLVEVGLDADSIASQWRGRIWRRVVDRRDMPPPSASGVVPGYQMPTDAERELLSEWLLAGAR